jgi:hypothetical protein
MIVDDHGGEPGNRVRNRHGRPVDDCGHRTSSFRRDLAIAAGLPQDGYLLGFGARLGFL